MKRITTIWARMAAVATVVALASVSGAAVPQTASALCRRVIPTERSNWADRTGIGFWTCYNRQAAGEMGGFSKIAEEPNEGRRLPGGNFCYHVESAGEYSTWANNRCAGNALTAGYFRSTESPWFAFRESAAKGKPVDKVAAGSGGEQLFKTKAGTIDCKALSLTEGEEPSETESAGLGLAVQFEECKAFEKAATVKPVELEFSAEGNLSLGTSLEVSATECTVTFPASKNQTLGKVTYSNESGKVEIEPSVTGLTSEGSGSGCSYSSESGGTYSGKSLVGWATSGTLEWVDSEKEHLKKEKEEREKEEKEEKEKNPGNGKWEQCAEGSSGTKYSTNQCTTASESGKDQWKEVAGTEAVVSKGSLLLKDAKTVVGVAEVECYVEAEGVVGPKQNDKIKTIKVGSCRAVKVCEAGTAKMEAVDLPWQTEAYETEGKYFDSLSAGGSGNPGLKITCKVLKIEKSDTCKTEGVEILELKNESTAGSLLVKGTYQHNRKAECTEGGEESGEIVGSLATLKTSGAGLRVR
jgi:hypothetical protein